jgi:hypothetical protein
LNDETSDEESDEEVVNPGDYVAQPDDVLPPDAVDGFYGNYLGPNCSAGCKCDCPILIVLELILIQMLLH